MPGIDRIIIDRILETAKIEEVIGDFPDVDLKKKGVRYLEMAEGYVTRLALDGDDQIIGYEFVSLGKMTDFIKKGLEPNEAYKKAMGHYGRFENAAKYVDPRKE